MINKKKPTTNQVVRKLIKCREEEKSLRKQLDILEQSDKIKKNSKYIGNCYMEVPRKDRDGYFITVYYIYGLDKDNSNPESIKVWYWNKDDSSVHIEYNNHFNPNADEYYDATCTYKKISSKEFLKHYMKAGNNIFEKVKPLTEKKK